MRLNNHTFELRLANHRASSAAFLAREGLPVTMIFDTVDAFLASPTPLPPYIRKSRYHDQIIFTLILILTKSQVFIHNVPSQGVTNPPGVSLLSCYTRQLLCLTLARRFLHTTWLGAAIVYCFWNALAKYSVKAVIPNFTKVFTTNCSSTFWASRATPHFDVLTHYFGTHAQTTKGSLARGVFTRSWLWVRYLSLRPRE